MRALRRGDGSLAASHKAAKNCNGDVVDFGCVISGTISLHLTFDIFLTEFTVITCGLNSIPVSSGGGWPCDQASIGDDCWSHYGELDQHVSRQLAQGVGRLDP